MRLKKKCFNKIVAIEKRIFSLTSEFSKTTAELVDWTAFIMSIFLCIQIPVLALISFPFVLGLARSITRPLKKSVAMLRDISEGESDLTKELKIITNDEIGELAIYYNKFIIKIRLIIKEIMALIVQLSDSFSDMSSSNASFSNNAQDQAASAEEITASAEEVSADMDLVSDKAEEQFESMTALISKMNALSRLIDSTNDEIKETMNLTKEISILAKDGETSLNSMSESMLKIRAIHA